jgi:hypothetical protein
MAAADDDDVEGVRSGNHAATSIAELENAEAGKFGGIFVSRETGFRRGQLFHVKQFIKVNPKFTTKYYLPTQNSRKITSRMSSTSTRPSNLPSE